MTRIPLLLAVGTALLWSGDACAAELRVWGASSMTKVRPSDSMPSMPDAGITLHAARNESEAFQIVLRAKGGPVTNIRVQPGELIGPRDASIRSAAFALNRVAYVKVKTPSHVGSRSGAWPDPLPPLKQPFAIEPDQGNQPVWVTVTVGKGLPPGRYAGALRVSAEGIADLEVPLALQVYDVDLPDGTGPVTTWFDQSTPDILEAHGLMQADRERVAAMLDTYFRFQARRRLAPSAPPVPLDSNVAGGYLEGPQLGLFRLPSPGTSDSSAGALSEEHLRRGVMLAPTVTPGTGEAARSEHTPAPVVPPGVRVLSVSSPGASQLDLADLWCVAPDDLSVAEVGALRKLGEQVWWRLDERVRHPLPTYLIDDDGVCPRILAWLQALYRVSGVWCPSTTGWSRDATGAAASNPLDVWSNPETMPGANGAGYLLYPGSEVGVQGPVSSIRLELIRDGVEDLLCFQLLESALDSRAGALNVGDFSFGRERVRELVRRVATSTTSFQRNPKLLADARVALLQSLETARSDPPLLVRMQPADASQVIHPGEGVRLVGATSAAAAVTVNDHPVTTNAKGVFRAKAYPLPGENEFIVRATVGEAATQTRRGCTVVEDPELTRLGDMIREAEAQGVTLTDASAVLASLRSRLNEGTYDREDSGRARQLATECRRKVAARKLEQTPEPQAVTATGPYHPYLLKVARALDAKRDYARALRVLQVAKDEAQRAPDAPCRVEAGTYYGKVGFRLTNGRVSLIVWRQGGRVVDFRFVGVPLLHHLNLAAVPDNEAPPLTADVGGIEDCELGSNRVALINWNLAVLEEFDERVTIAARTVLPDSDLKLERRLTVKRGSPEVLFTYRVTNPGPKPASFRWRSRIACGIGLPATGTGGDPTGDVLWTGVGEAATPALPALREQSRTLLNASDGQCAVYDAAFRMGLGLRYDHDTLALSLVSDEPAKRYWLEPNCGRDREAVQIEPDDLLHFTVTLLPLLGVDSPESVKAKLEVPTGRMTGR